MIWRFVMKLKNLLKWFRLDKKEEIVRPVMKPIKLKPTKRKKWWIDKFGNKRQVVEVNCPRKIAKRITILAKEIRKRKEAS